MVKHNDKLIKDVKVTPLFDKSDKVVKWWKGDNWGQAATLVDTSEMWSSDD